METSATLGGSPGLPAQGIRRFQDEIRLAQGVADCPAAICSWEIKPVGNRAAPIGSAIKSGQSIAHAQDAADISGIAVSVPAAGVDDGLPQAEISPAVKQAQDHQS